MAIGKIKASRVNRVDAPTYIGEEGILFYNFANGVIRLSDGVTPGGVPVPYNIASNTTIGGIKAGPGVVVSNDGELYIDTANLALSFGNFTADNNLLTITNVDQNMILRTQGNAEIQLIGNIGFYKPDGLPPNQADRYFSAFEDGQVKFYIPTVDVATGAMEIIGSSTGNTFPTVNTGVMVHVTGQPSTPSRVYNDGNNDFAAFVGRRFNGNVASPTPVLASQDIMRISATGYDGNTIPGTASSRITFKAAENFTTGAFGGNLTFSVVPTGSTTLVDKAWVTGAGLTVNGNLIVNGNLRYDIAINNATATQLTGKSSTVTCNGRTGQITTSNESLAKGSAVTFTVNNSYITAVTDVPVVVFQSGATANSYSVSVTRVQVGSFNITITNSGSGPLTDTIVINFAILKVA